MARSRNIKPGFFLNDKLAECEPLARLLFAGLWCIADREGRLEDRPKRIKAEVLPYDECDVDQLLDQLAKYEFIIRYEVEGERYIQIINFLKHQNPHVREAASTIPPPPAEEQAPEKHQTSTVQEQEQNSSSPADSFKLIPDSLKQTTESNNALTKSSAKPKGAKKFNEKPVEKDAVGLSVESDLVLQDVGKHYQQKIGIMSPADESKLAKWIELGMCPSLLVAAINKAAEAGKRRINYIEGILKNWYNDGHRTLNDLVKAEQKREQAKAEKQKGREPPGGGGVPNASAYKPVDPEAVRRWKEMHPDDYG